MPTVVNALRRSKIFLRSLLQKCWRHKLGSVCAVILALFPTGVLAAPAPADCGTVIAEANNDISSFNPLYANDLGNSRAAQLLFQPLVWVNRYGNVDYSRSLAAKIGVSADTTTYTMTLRPWHWSDGTPVTAADLVYDWRMIARLGLNYPGYGSGGIPSQIKSVTALDPLHAQIVLTGPVNPLWFIDNGLSTFTPLPAHAWAGFSLDTLYQMQSQPGFFTIVDGPMRIARLDVGMDAVFMPNRRYDGPKLHLQRLVLNFVHTDGTAVQQVEAGELDFAPVPMELLGALHHLPGVHLALLSPVSFWYYLSLNLQNPKVAFLRDVRVRQAIEDAIDQKAIIKTVYHGFGDQVYTAVPPVDANLLAPGLSGDYPVGYDPAKARALLAAAGYTPGPQGILTAHGHALEFTALMTPDSAEDTEMVLMMQAQLRAVGIRMNLHQVAFGEMMQVLQQEPQAWEAAELGTVSNPYPSGEAMFATGAGENNGGYSDPVMDRLISASINRPGLAGLYAYERYIAAQQPVIFLATEKHLDLVANRITGVDGFSDGALIAPDALRCTSGNQN
jgi:peptide/nickel transport system substrate-binding protein